MDNIEKRIREKKRLYNHAVIYFVSSVFALVIQYILAYGKDYNWAIGIIVVWGFVFVLHLIKVFVTNRFFGKEWESRMRETLKKKEENRLKKMENTM